MEQIIQSLKNGKMSIAEVPFPALNEGCILVRNYYSVISAGTEGKTVKDARAGYIGKARARKEEVRKVIKTAKTLGIANTYRMVMNKLDSPVPLGYCCAGKVIAVANDITDIRPGDFVACGGSSANHSEVISVPRNLCAKIPDNVNSDAAAFTTLGAIALQGIRQADLRLGESCAVIGLGLVGQLTLQMLEASGIKTIGIDIDSVQVNHAIKNGFKNSYVRDSEFLAGAVAGITNGYGVDAVIITAGTSSTDPVDFSGEICRQKGKVVIVGAVPTGFKRTDYFRKELDLRMSCSYGPGRYDNEYEEKGIDYPYAYVRWTENRNMETFLDLISTNKIKVENLITHVYDFKNATDAYDLLINKNEPFLGIVLKYETNNEVAKRVVISKTSESHIPSGEPIIGFIGAGSFAQNFLLPAVKDQAHLKGIATARPANAKNLAEKYNFDYCTGDAKEIFDDKSINTIFIATRHDSHARYVREALKSGKNVFVEKPLCMNEEELEEIKDIYIESGKKLMIGFNRRFSAYSRVISNMVKENNNAPVSINYRINAGVVAADHWVHDLKTGGGRIIGEACHFIDLCMFFCNSPITSVSALSIPGVNHKNDTVTISLSFKNGSIANISYFSNGNKNLSKELVEVYIYGRICIIDDFNSLKIIGNKVTEDKSKNQDKGHRSEVSEFLQSIRLGLPTPIPFEEQYISMLATFKVMQSIAENGERIFIG